MEGLINMQSELDDVIRAQDFFGRHYDCAQKEVFKDVAESDPQERNDFLNALSHDFRYYATVEEMNKLRELYVNLLESRISESAEVFTRISLNFQETQK